MRNGRCLTYVRTPVAEKLELEELGNKNEDSRQYMKYQTIRCFLSGLTGDVGHVRHGKEIVYPDVSVVDQNCPINPERTARNVSTPPDLYLLYRKKA